MYYFDTSILDTDADVVVVPVSVDAVIKPGTLHHAVAAKLPESYRAEYFTNVRKGILHAGEPDLYFPEHGSWQNRAVWNLPALASLSTTITLPHVMRGLAKIVRFMQCEEHLSIAVPHLCPDVLSWETMEYVLGTFEAEEVLGKNLELWLYPPYESAEREEEEDNQVLCV